MASLVTKHPLRTFQRAVIGWLDLVSNDELICNVVEVIAYDLRLGTYTQNIVADTLDQRGLPARRDGAEGVPGVAGDETEI